MAIQIENGKITGITIDGKKVKAGSMRGIRKAQEASYWKLYTEGGVRQNPYSGVKVELNALELTIYEFCLNWYNRYDSGWATESPIQCVNDMKYLLLDLNPDAYFDLLD